MFINKLSKEKLLPILALIFFAFLSLTWFKGDNLLGGGDHSSVIYLSKYFDTFDSTWRGKINTGKPESGLAYLIPYGLLYSGLDLIGLGPVASEKVYFYLAFLLPGLCMYFFLTKVWGEKVSGWIRAAAAIFYMVNPFMMLLPISLNLTKYAVYLSLPIMSYFLVSLFEEEEFSTKLKYAILLAVSSTLASSASINIAEATPLVVVLLILSVYKFFSSKNKIVHLGLLLASVFLGLLLNFWWLYSVFYEQYLLRTESLATLGTFRTGGASVFDAFRLFGFWALNSYNGQVPYYTFGSYYYSWKGVMATYSIPFLVFFPIGFLTFFRKSISKLYRKRVLLYTFIALFGMFLAKGTNPPFGELFDNLYNNIPIFKIFREPFSKFTLITVFSFTVLICFTLDQLSKLLNKIIPIGNVVLPLFFLLIVGYSVKPMFSGDFISDRYYGGMKSLLAKIPEYWYEISAYSDINMRGERLALMPRNTYFRKSFIWEKGFVGRPANLLLSSDILWYEIGPFNNGDVLITHLFDDIAPNLDNPTEEDITRFINTARLLHAKYLLQMNDFDWIAYKEEYAGWSIENMESLYAKLSDYLVLEKSFGKLTPEYLMSIPFIKGGEDVYRFKDDPDTDDYMTALSGKDALQLYTIRDQFLIHKFYIPDIIEVSPTMEDMLSSLQLEKYLVVKPLFIENSLTSVQPEDQFSGTVKSTEINSSRYKIDIESENDKIVLVFGESYSDGWKLAKECTWFGCSSFINSEHFIANHYANGWVLSKEQIKEPLYVVHTSDHRLRLGIFVSTSGIALTIILFGVSKLVRKKEKHEF